MQYNGTYLNLLHHWQIQSNPIKVRDSCLRMLYIDLTEV